MYLSLPSPLSRGGLTGKQGPDFGRLIAKAILAGFLKEYPEFTAGATPPP